MRSRDSHTNETDAQLCGPVCLSSVETGEGRHIPDIPHMVRPYLVAKCKHPVSVVWCGHYMVLRIARLCCFDNRLTAFREVTTFMPNGSYA